MGAEAPQHGWKMIFPFDAARRALLLRLLLTFAALNFVWEVLQLPLYTIWWNSSPGANVFAVLHCAAGDLIIGSGAFFTAIIIAGRGWPDDRAARLRVAIVLTLLGLGYTVYSEWLNVAVRATWAYTDLMPRVPLLSIGLAPLLQWLLLPPLALWLATRNVASNKIR
jgi:hypothetical protein